jgi:hypothetical protein
MAFGSWRGTVGIVRPTLRTGGFEDLIRMLPEGIGFISRAAQISAQL